MGNKDVQPLKVYTGVLTLNKAFKILKRAKLDFLLTGKSTFAEDFSKLQKHLAGQASYSEDFIREETAKYNKLLFDIVDSLIGEEFLLKDFFEAITKIEITDDTDYSLDVIMVTVMSFFFDIGGALTSFIPAILSNQGNRAVKK